MSLVRYYVFSLRNMYDGYIDTADVTNEGVLGLMNAIENFDPEKKVKFETYASIVIRGTIIDYIRKNDNIPHRLSKIGKEAQDAFNALYMENEREPTDEEVARKLGLNSEELNKYLSRIMLYQVFSLDELLYNDVELKNELSDNSIGATEEIIFREDLIKRLSDAIETLPERERLIITLYYHESLKLREIGEVLELTEGRVSQLHAKAVNTLKSSLEDLRTDYLTQID